MREILFRAKRIDNEEWIYGYIVKLGRERLSDPERYGICNKIITIDGSGVCYNLKVYEIIPETVGQYTGLTDKNSKKIFEGDIVTAYFQSNRSKQKFSVIFENGTFLFDNDHVKVPVNDIYCLKIIGNIHDNSELLKGSEK